MLRGIIAPEINAPGINALMDHCLWDQYTWDQCPWYETSPQTDVYPTWLFWCYVKLALQIFPAQIADGKLWIRFELLVNTNDALKNMY